MTGGIAPNEEGAVFKGAAAMLSQTDADNHRIVTDAVHKNGGKIAMQILHAGRYAYSPDCVAPSAVKSPISPFVPIALDDEGINKQIDDFVNCAQLAKSAGYDGIEIMGSEGYFINEFFVEHTNKRLDTWGGSYKNRMRLPVTIVEKIRSALGENFLLIFRLSMIDLIPNGSSHDEVVILAKKLEAAGINIAGHSIDIELVEIIEVPKHPWFVGCQFHPEFTSTPRDGHPLFTSFIDAALKYKSSGLRVTKNAAM